MADALTQTSVMTPEMAIYYKREFLETADKVRKYDFLVEKQAFPANSGKVVYFTRTVHFDPVTAAATEGVNPTAIAFSSETVSSQVAEYSFATKLTSFYELTTIDTGLTAKSKELGYHAGISLDTILRNVLVAGATAQYAGGKTQMTAVNATDTFSVAELRKAHKTLFDNAAPTFENGMYRAVISSQAEYELKGDTAAGNWINLNIYNDGKNAELVKKGVIGSLYGFDIVPTNNAKSESSTVTVYHSLVAGKGAAAEVDISGKGNASIIHKTSGPQDTSNPTNAYSTMSWKVDAYSAKVMNSNWIIDIIHA